MIDKVVIRNFKRFERVEFDLGGKNIVLAGPNNSGKTTILQAISAWSFALNRWLLTRGDDFNKRNGWTKVPVTRQQFLPVSVSAFDALWHQRWQGQSKEFIIEVTAMQRTLGMEFHYDTNEQMYVAPTWATYAETLRGNLVQTVFVPAMSGMVTEEPEYKPAKLEQLLGQNRPGEVLRNLLVLAAADQTTWDSLVRDIEELFRIRLLLPNSGGPDIIAEYSHVGADLIRFDVGSGGSGFQQVLMLLAFLGTRRGSVLLLDEPDAHLHVFLQERIHQRLSAAAARTKSQLIVATHSEVIIDAVENDEIYVVIDQPVRLVGASQVAALKSAMKWLGNTDLMKARMSIGILYLEGSTDLNLLREWAKVLDHPSVGVLEPSPFWRSISRAQVDAGEERDGEEGVPARSHYEALQLARPGYPALMIEDRDKRDAKTGVFGKSPPMCRWRRYEIESYLLHPVALARFVEHRVGAGAASAQHLADLQQHFVDTYPPAFLKDPLADLPMLVNTKARTDLLPPALDAAGLPGIPYTEYHEIASLMLPTEIHPEVKEKLDAICTAFGIPLTGTQPSPPGATS